MSGGGVGADTKIRVKAVRFHKEVALMGYNMKLKKNICRNDITAISHKIWWLKSLFTHEHSTAL